jgi:hypothetical protein
MLLAVNCQLPGFSLCVPIDSIQQKLSGFVILCSPITSRASLSMKRSKIFSKTPDYLDLFSHSLVTYWNLYFVIFQVIGYWYRLPTSAAGKTTVSFAQHYQPEFSRYLKIARKIFEFLLTQQSYSLVMKLYVSYFSNQFFLKSTRA